MAIETINSTARQSLGAMFFGTVISFIFHGITCCQMIWFFRAQSGRSGKKMAALVIFAWLAEALNCGFIFCATLDMFLLPAITYAAKYTNPCTDWIARAQTIPSTMCTGTVEGFFIMRIWRLSEHKKLTMLAFIPYLAGYGFGVAQIVRSFQLRCHPSALDIDEVLVFSATACRIFCDGVVAVTMCTMLYRRSSGFTTHTNTIKIVRVLILWSISTGVLMWITSVLFILSSLSLLPIGFTIFFCRGGLYINAMLAQCAFLNTLLLLRPLIPIMLGRLNARARFRAMAEESIPLSSLSLGESSSSSRAVSRVAAIQA